MGEVKYAADERCLARPRRPGAIFKGRCFAHPDRCTSATADRGQPLEATPAALCGVSPEPGKWGNVGRLRPVLACPRLVTQLVVELAPSDAGGKGCDPPCGRHLSRRALVRSDRMARDQSGQGIYAFLARVVWLVY